MKVENLFHIMLICFFGLAACKGDQQKLPGKQKPKISLTADSSAVVVDNLSADILEYFDADSVEETEWQSFFSVYPHPRDPELKDLQRPLSGRYSVRDNIILFVPAEPFKKDSSYFARFYIRVVHDPSELIMGGKLPAKSEISELVFKR